jgi:hypothetical protein
MKVGRTHLNKSAFYSKNVIFIIYYIIRLNSFTLKDVFVNLLSCCDKQLERHLMCCNCTSYADKLEKNPNQSEMGYRF